ncbi:nitroreductase/quinone reductase family protein [Streptomyces iakyrus]|uniref:nitroreductase/quinone reductase family protein n=1 Tax=Streptomyces iakyrus TaxID=68219 RepID=UPI003D8D48D1
MLGTIGHRSGTPRATPLAAHRAADGTWLVVGSNFGPSHHPAWSTNLLHAPRPRSPREDIPGRSAPADSPQRKRAQQRNRILLALPSTTPTPPAPAGTSASSASPRVRGVIRTTAPRRRARRAAGRRRPGPALCAAI